MTTPRRILNYQEIRAEALSRGGEVKVLAGLDTRKDQPHDAAYWEAQTRAWRIRWDTWIATGRLEILGPRLFRLNPIPRPQPEETTHQIDWDTVATVESGKVGHVTRDLINSAYEDPPDPQDQVATS